MQFLADDFPFDALSADFVNWREVLTGHHQGMIALNIKEAEPGVREQVREIPNE